MILTVYEFKMSEKIPLATTSYILKVDEPDAMSSIQEERAVFWTIGEHGEFTFLSRLVASLY